MKFSTFNFQFSKKFQVSNSKIHERGFTLIEAIVAIGVISVGFVGALVILSKSASQAGFLRERIIASHLAAEGIEVVINIRDTNWLKLSNPAWPWLSGLIEPKDAPVGTKVTGIVNYDTNNSITQTQASNDPVWCLAYINGIYQHINPPCNTTFKRHIVLTKKTELISGQSVNFLEVQSIVDWQEKGLTRTITVIDNLYDWK